MASLTTIGLFTGTLVFPPAPQNGIHPLQQPKASPFFGLYDIVSEALMPFYEYFDFMWRVKSWKFEWDVETVETTPSGEQSVVYNQTFAQKETDMLLPYDFGFDTIGFLQYTKIPSPSSVGGFIYPLNWFTFGSYWDQKYYWDQNINTEDLESQWRNLNYFPRWFTQSFAAPTKITKPSYLTFDITFGGPPYSTGQFIRTCTMSPSEWWEYDPEDGKGPIYNKYSGERIRFDL